MKPRAIFFDMDDTLLDGYSAMQGAWAAVCSEFSAATGCDPGQLREAIRREAAEFWRDESKVGHEWRTRLDQARTLVVRNALSTLGCDPGPGEEISLRYAHEHRERLVLFEDARRALEALRSRGFRLALLTNGPAPLQRDKIERFQLAEYFEVIVVEGEFGHGKPHPQVFAHALESVRADPGDAWHIGDNLYADIAGAQAAGIHAVWIHRDRLEIRNDSPAVPDRIIGHLAEIEEALTD